MSKPELWIIVILSGSFLTYVAVWNGHVGTGWSYETSWIATVRMVFPFFAGLLLYRTGKLIRIPNAYAFCSLMLIILFCIPAKPVYGWYEAACIIIAFPIIVAAGAGGQISGRWARVCKFAGAISYPIYILHYPFIYIYTE
jgi:peptidoglycan/LPS O-acetylase OafA/YrhL